MKRIELEAISLFERNLVLIRFSDLFPTGEGGRHEKRTFGDLIEADFRSTGILNKFRRFSLNDQSTFSIIFMKVK